MPALVGKMLYLKVLERYVESFSVGASSHETHLYRDVVLQPGVAHHHVVLVIEGVEDFYRIQAADGFNPYVRNGFVYQRPYRKPSQAGDIEKTSGA